ncbi:hypothetical protein L9F63_023981, partial [Diploptera punctata]
KQCRRQNYITLQVIQTKHALKKHHKIDNFSMSNNFARNKQRSSEGYHSATASGYSSRGVKVQYNSSSNKSSFAQAHSTTRNEDNLKEMNNKSSPENLKGISSGQKKSKDESDDNEAENIMEIPTFTAVEASLTFTDSEDEDKITEECYKIFKEYEPQLNQASMSKESDKPEESVKDVPKMDEVLPEGKKRVAHSGVEFNPPRLTAIPKRQPNPVEIMQSRFAKMREIQAKKAETTSSLFLQSFPGLSSGAANPPARRRISYVPNVSMLLSEKNRVQELVRMKQNAASENKQQGDKKGALSNEKMAAHQKTIAQTVPKGLQRIAHHSQSIAARGPLITNGGKIGVAVRQRYLDAIINEFKKFLSPVDANSKKSIHAFETYPRCRTLKTSIMFSVYAEKRNLIVYQRIQLEEQENRRTGANVSSTKVVSHSAILGGPSGTKGSWSIIRSKPVVKNENLYSQLCKFLLTEEQLVENGFPRPHPQDKSGAVVKLNVYNKRAQVPKDLRNIMRICSRCGKNYKIDKNGFQIGDDACNYHYGRIYTIR